MSPEEEKLMKAITNDNADEVDVMLRIANLNLNFTDENGMTPLENACYKGNFDVVHRLIRCGAHVNSRLHVHGYTALMFAALGGHVRIINLLLENGADVSATNSVNRTAAQMAAFVGQHAAASAINNFIPREELEKFTKPTGVEKEAKLPPHLLEPLLQFVRKINVNPVRVAMEFTSSKLLFENHQKVVKILNLLCEKEMEKEEPNEALAMKYHHLSFLIGQIVKFFEQDKSESLDDKLLNICKYWLKGDANGFPVTMEKLLRQSIREFPFKDSAIFLQLLKTLYDVPIGSEPSAVTLLARSINGQKGFDEDSPVCSTCGESLPAKKCSQCKSAPYCDARCQKIHWSSHRKICSQLKSGRESESQTKDET